MESWTYDPATERWHVRRGDALVECVLIPLSEAGSDEPFTNRNGYQLGWCETHQQSEWIKLATPEVVE